MQPSWPQYLNSLSTQCQRSTAKRINARTSAALSHALTHTHSHLQFLYEHFLCVRRGVREGSSKKRVPKQVRWILPRVSSFSSCFSPPLPLYVILPPLIFYKFTS